MKTQLQAVIPFEAVSLYPFAWLDELLEIRTNPNSIYYQEPSQLDCHKWREEARNEIQRIYRILREQTFGLYQPSQVRPIIEQYLETIDFHGANAWNNRQILPEDIPTHGLLIYVTQLLADLKERVIHCYAIYLPEKHKLKNKPQTVPIAAKLVCTLSGDQIGIILRAADDTKILQSRSISLVYKTLIPYLATTHRSELSWQSVRSNSYHPGESDKAAVIVALEAMAATIRSYH